MESNTNPVLEISASVGKKSHDDVDIPSYVESVVPPAGLSTLQKLFGIGIALLIAASAFAGWRYFTPDTAAIAPPSIALQIASNVPASTRAPLEADNRANSIASEEVSASNGRLHHPKVNMGADVIAAAKPATGLMYVRRNNSDLRPAPSASSVPIKKLAKGDKVRLLALSDKWAQVEDAGTRGWMRASVLKDTPPGEKRSKKKSDHE